MARKKTQRKADSKKNMQVFGIEAPDYLNSVPIGITMASEPEKLIGRSVEATVGELTKDMSKNNIKMLFKIVGVNGDMAKTELVGHELTTDYLRSIVKRQTSKIDATIDIRTRDGYVVRVKPTSFTVKRARSSQIKAIRELMIKIVAKRAAGLKFEEFAQEALLGKLAANIYRQAKIIYPLRRVEIRKTEVLSLPSARKQ